MQPNASCCASGLYLGWLRAYIRSEAALLVIARLTLGALTIRTGAVPDLARGPGHTAPTYIVGSRDCSPLYGRCGFAFFMDGLFGNDTGS